MKPLVGDRVNASECARYMTTTVAADEQYSILDYYVPLEGADDGGNASDAAGRATPTPRPPGNATWAALPAGRALPATPCVQEYKTALGKHGAFRVAVLTYREVLPPLLLLILAKLICRLCLRMPWMRATRKRNERLQRTAIKRQAEVRRMTEGGQEFAVKRAAKATGKGEAAKGVIQAIKVHATRDGAGHEQKRVTAGTPLAMKGRSSAGEGSAGGDGSGDSGAGIGGGGALLGVLRSNTEAPEGGAGQPRRLTYAPGETGEAPAPAESSFAGSMRALSAAQASEQGQDL